MKQVKILVLALVVLMGVGFTSCMNGDDDTTVRRGAFVKVYTGGLGSIYFKDANGFKYYPSATSMATMKSTYGFDPSSGDMAYIIYQYDSATQTVTENTESLQNLQLVYAFGLDATVESVSEKGASNDSIAKAPIRSLDGTIGSSYKYEPVMFDESTLLLQIDYFMGIDGILSHYFTLVYYPNEPAEENTIKLYLRHNNGKDTSTNYTSVNLSGQYPFVFYKAFNLRKLNVPINTDTKIIIETQVNNTNIDLEDKNNTSSKTYEVQIKAKE